MWARNAIPFHPSLAPREALQPVPEAASFGPVSRAVTWPTAVGRQLPVVARPAAGGPCPDPGTQGCRWVPEQSNRLAQMLPFRTNQSRSRAARTLARELGDGGADARAAALCAGQLAFLQPSISQRRGSERFSSQRTVFQETGYLKGPCDDRGAHKQNFVLTA